MNNFHLTQDYLFLCLSPFPLLEMRWWRQKENEAYILSWNQVGMEPSVFHHLLSLLALVEIEPNVLSPTGFCGWCSQSTHCRCHAQAFWVLLILLQLFWVPQLLSAILVLLLKTVGSVGTLLPWVGWGSFQFCPHSDPLSSIVLCCLAGCNMSLKGTNKVSLWICPFFKLGKFLSPILVVEFYSLYGLW